MRHYHTAADSDATSSWVTATAQATSRSRSLSMPATASSPRTSRSREIRTAVTGTTRAAAVTACRRRRLTTARITPIPSLARSRHGTNVAASSASSIRSRTAWRMPSADTASLSIKAGVRRRRGQSTARTTTTPQTTRRRRRATTCRPRHGRSSTRAATKPTGRLPAIAPSRATATIRPPTSPSASA